MTSPSRVGSHSPASPRLPSPPPFPEVQIGHRSPSPSSARSSLIETPEDHPSEDYGAARRIRPGTKSADMASGPPLVPLVELDSAFQLQEHLKSLYLAATTSPTSTNLRQPITRESATSLATPPPGIDRSLWLYELCRFLVQRANILIVGFFSDNPPCSAVNCPEMRASEWQYLCAVHDPPKSCCAIDYCCHTLDWAAGVLTSQRHFPSRLTLGSGIGSKESAAASGSDAASVRQLTNIFRRVYRMFAHAWFQHKDVFWSIENQEGLYVFYKTVCDVYNLIPEDNYTVPPEAEGLGEDNKQLDEGGWTREPLHGTSTTLSANSETSRSSRPSSLDFTRGNTTSLASEKISHSSEPDTASTMSGTGATTRRHKHTPSTGSFVTTIHEGDEDIPSPAPTTTGETPFFGTNTSTTITEVNDKTKLPKTARWIDSESNEAAKGNTDSKPNSELPPKTDLEIPGDNTQQKNITSLSSGDVLSTSDSESHLLSATSEAANNSADIVVTTKEIPDTLLKKEREEDAEPNSHADTDSAGVQSEALPEIQTEKETVEEVKEAEKDGKANGNENLSTDTKPISGNSIPDSSSKSASAEADEETHQEK